VRVCHDIFGEDVEQSCQASGLHDRAPVSTNSPHSLAILRVPEICWAEVDRLHVVNVAQQYAEALDQHFVAHALRDPHRLPQGPSLCQPSNEDLRVGPGKAKLITKLGQVEADDARACETKAAPLFTTCFSKNDRLVVLPLCEGKSVAKSPKHNSRRSGIATSPSPPLPKPFRPSPHSPPCGGGECDRRSGGPHSNTFFVASCATAI